MGLFFSAKFDIKMGLLQVSAASPYPNHQSRPPPSPNDNPPIALPNYVKKHLNR